jgi:hypothetical protein
MSTQRHQSQYAVRFINLYAMLSLRVIVFLTYFAGFAWSAQPPGEMIAVNNYASSKHVVVEVHNSEDLNGLYVTYLELVEGLVNADDVIDFEVRLAPGKYSNAHLTLKDVDQNRLARISVRLAADSQDAPAVLEDILVTIRAGRVQIENVVLTGSKRSGVVRASVAKSFEAKNVLIIRNNIDEELGFPVVSVDGFGINALNATFKNVWFVQNNKATKSTLLSFDGGPTYFERVEFDGVAFLENDIRTEVSMYNVANVVLRDALIVKRPGKLESRGLLSLFTVPVSVTLDHSLIAVEQADQFASGETPQHVDLTGTRILASDVQAKTSRKMWFGSNLEQSGWASSRSDAVHDFVMALPTDRIGSVASSRAALEVALGLIK